MWKWYETITLFKYYLVPFVFLKTFSPSSMDTAHAWTSWPGGTSPSHPCRPWDHGRHILQKQTIEIKHDNDHVKVSRVCKLSKTIIFIFVEIILIPVGGGVLSAESNWWGMNSCNDGSEFMKPISLSDPSPVTQLWSTICHQMAAQVGLNPWSGKNPSLHQDILWFTWEEG